MTCHPSARACGGLLLVGLLALVTGCGPNYKARAVVKGKVSIGNKNLTTGTVMFYGKDNLSASATIDKEGNYVMNDAPLGDVKITVMVPKPPMGGGMMKMPGMGKMKDIKSVNPENPGQSINLMGDMPDRVVPIPDKYGNVATSGLTYSVQKGEQTHDIKLTP